MPTPTPARFLWLCMSSVLALLLLPAAAHAGLHWPADGASRVAGCGFNERCVTAGQFHAGTDYGGGSGTIRAVADGPIVAVVTNGANDHGLGNTLIQQIDTTWGRRYALYAHLSSFAVTSGCVRAGQAIATMGGSGFGNANRWDRHLHLEIKRSPVLHNPSGGGPYWGYTPGPAQNYGYEDPSYWLANAQSTGSCSPPPARVKFMGQEEPGLVRLDQIAGSKTVRYGVTLRNDSSFDMPLSQWRLGVVGDKPWPYASSSNVVGGNRDRIECKDGNADDGVAGRGELIKCEWTSTIPSDAPATARRIYLDWVQDSGPYGHTNGDLGIYLRMLLMSPAKYAPELRATDCTWRYVVQTGSPTTSDGWVVVAGMAEARYTLTIENTSDICVWWPTGVAPFRLATNRPLDRGSGFAKVGDGWLSQNRVALPGTEPVLPFQRGTFDMGLRALSSVGPGRYPEWMSPVVEGKYHLADQGTFIPVERR